MMFRIIQHFKADAGTDLRIKREVKDGKTLYTLEDYAHVPYADGDRAGPLADWALKNGARQVRYDYDMSQDPEVEAMRRSKL